MPRFVLVLLAALLATGPVAASSPQATVAANQIDAIRITRALGQRAEVMVVLPVRLAHRWNSKVPT